MKLPRYPKYKDSGVEWLGQVPEDWKVLPLKFLTKKIGSGITPRGGSEVYSDEGVLFLRSQNVYDDGLHLDEVAFIPHETDEEMSSTRVKPGDILLNITGASLGRTALVPEGFAPANVNQHVCIIRLRGAKLNGFISYAMKSSAIKGQIEIAENGAAREGLNFVQIGGFHIALPTADEEAQAISLFLDRETAKIDALVAEQQHLIELLKEQRQAIIAEAVTKGIDADAPMKPSGIDWIGDIPAHWSVERTRWLLPERDQRSKTGEEEMLTVSHLTGVTPRSEKNVTMFEAETNEGYKLCRAGDLVINTLWAWMGAMGIAPVFGIVSPAYNVYIPGKRLWPSYVDSLVRMPLFAQEITRYSKGVWTSRLRLYPEGLYQAYFPVPPLDEQKAIAQHIADENARIESLMTAANKSIELLQEHRSTLISNAVTGQIDVRNYRPEEAPAVCR
ncbi:MAG: restriction endonuclease subunit S [Acidobacteriaceae bacterium]